MPKRKTDLKFPETPGKKLREIIQIEIVKIKPP
jgi:hypothetical protein